MPGKLQEVAETAQVRFGDARLSPQASRHVPESIRVNLNISTSQIAGSNKWPERPIITTFPV
ncbi:hypothetical protein N7540_009943 [Penicillium herquei]|nr:hypothetical protein N7540_009943 [Penicillium herquei]